MTLALLITAVGGAWAQTQWESGDCTVTLNNGTLTVSGNGGMAAYLNLSDRPWDGNRNDITSVVVESGVTSVGFNAFSSFSTMTSVTLPEGLTAIGPNAFNSCSSLQSITIPSTVTSIGEGAFSRCSAMTSVTLPEGLTAIGGLTFSECSSLTSVTIPSTVTSIVDGAFMGCSAITSVTLPEGLTTIGAAAFMNCSSLTSVTIPSTVTSIAEYAFMSSSAISDVNLYANPDNLTWGDASMDFKSDKATQCHVLAEHLSTYQNNFSSVNVTFVGDLQPLATSEPVEVTTNAAEEGATFTEATFAMPAFDATAEYELVRDMGYKVAFSGVPTRARLAKDGDGKFHFADGLTFQLLDNIDAANPKDITSAEGITFMVGEVEAVDFEGNTFYQLNKATLVPLADFLADAHLGNYAICAVASTGEYDGSFSSGRIELFQGYEVTVGAGEYATFYKDENLYTEDEDAELYTIASVTDTEAVLSDAITVAPAETPLLVYNKSEQDKTFLLIPTTDDANEVTPATQFVGTLEATTIPASTTGADNYALNGYAFVWVKNAIEVGANKCWLHIASQRAAARAVTRSIVGGNGTTGIDAIENVTIDNEGWYDLQGRKLQSAPNRKGIYIHNGKKVVVRK